MTNTITRLRELLEKATPGPRELIRYEHGGGRLCVVEPDRTLIADFYNEGDRELIVAVINALPAMLEVAEAAEARCVAYEKYNFSSTIEARDIIYAADCRLEEACSKLNAKDHI